MFLFRMLLQILYDHLVELVISKQLLFEHFLYLRRHSDLVYRITFPRSTGIAFQSSVLVLVLHHLLGFLYAQEVDS